MRISRRRLLSGVGVAAAGLVSGRGLSTLVRAAEVPTVTFWSMPFVTAEVPPSFVQWFEQRARERLTDLRFASDYGPGGYVDMERKFVVQARTGTPDLLEAVWENVVTYQRAGLLEPITARINTWPDKAQFFESTLEGLTFNGEIWGIPYNTNARVLLYRKSILQKHGLPVPRTWSELVDIAARISRAEPRMAGFAFCTNRQSVRAPQEFLSWYFQLDHPVFEQAPDGSWRVRATPDKLARVFQLYRDLFFANDPPAADPNSRGIDWKALDYGYTSGQWAMVPMGPWIYGHRLESPERAAILEDTGIAPLPIPEGGKQATYLEIKPFLLNRYSRNKEVAWKAMQFLGSAEIIGEWAWVSGFVPPRKDVAQTERFRQSWWHQGFLEQLPTGVALEPVNWGPPIDAILEVLQEVVYQRSTPQQAGEALYQRLVQIARSNLL